MRDMYSTVLLAAQQASDIKGLVLLIQKFSEVRCVVLLKVWVFCVFSVLAGACCNLYRMEKKAPA